ncbi:clathrin light chain B-like isoform X3 [Carassius carassius]|uniref:clathrin light chain B-like isoform X3 n=1 Tax=Carassius carassius TaxID=217509 RepID=UPI00286843CA|nr:clathrin light chain B-like isoform X3 [Carassius carassius]
MADEFGFLASDNGVHAEEDPAAEFLAQQENEIAVIENDSAGLGALEDGGAPHVNTYTAFGGDFGDEPATAVNGDMFQDTNSTTDSYSAIAQVDIQRQEPESLRKWREEQKARLEELDAASKAAEAVWREKARKELEDWHAHQNEQMEKNKANNRIADKAFYKQHNSDAIGFVYV